MQSDIYTGFGAGANCENTFKIHHFYTISLTIKDFNLLLNMEILRVEIVLNAGRVNILLNSDGPMKTNDDLLNSVRQ